MGQDNLQYLHKWKNFEAILKYYPIYVYPRTGSVASQFDNHPQVHVFPAPLLDISATYIRETIQAGKSVQYLVPDKVNEYIVESGVYL